MTNLLRTVMNPALAGRIAETRAAAEAARRAALASAKTNFDALLVRGVICTVDDAEDRARRWAMVSDTALALGVPNGEVQVGLDLVEAERGELAQLHSIVASGESRREYLARVDAVMASLPKGTTERGRSCTHKGRAGWKFRGVGLVDGTDRLYCRVCGVSVVLPAPAPGLSPDAQAATATLAAAAAWYAANGEESLAVYATGGEDNWWRERNAVWERGIALRRQAASAASRP